MKDGLFRARQILDSLENTEIVAGISGGIDSMCLIDLIVKSRIDKSKVSVIHVDHNLREDSKRDKWFVEDYCLKHNIKIEVFSPDILNLAKESGRSIETEARAFRHSVFKKSCEEKSAEGKNAVLLLAHTASDQAETVLMHIFRGCGISGLKGMGERDGFIIRPLIYLLRSEVEAYAKENGIDFCEDITNSDLTYDRNFVRDLIKQVETRYKGASGHINRLSFLARESDKPIESLYPEFIREENSEDNAVVFLDKTALLTPQKNRYIIAAVKKAGLTYDFESKHAAAALSLNEKPVGKKINLPHGFICANERDNLVFFKPLSGSQSKNGAENNTENNGEIEFKEGENIIGGQRIFALGCERALKKGEIIVDADALSGATVRFRRDGDIFTPCNGKRKKLKEYLNGKKIENRLKDNIPLICKDNEVYVICGYELSDKAKITAETKRALRIFADGKN